jgi:hypothetical protein
MLEKKIPFSQKLKENSPTGEPPKEKTIATNFKL